MKASQSTAALRRKCTLSGNTVVDIEFALRSTLHEPYVEADFLHSITGRILARAEDETEMGIGWIEASLVLFSEAMDHGISPDRLGDGIDGNLSEYWECLFDPDNSRLKEEITRTHEVLGGDLLIIDCVEVCPEFRGHGIGRSAVERTIQIFGAACGLLACKPLPLQFIPSIASSPTLLKKLNAPQIGEEEALSKLRRYWSKLGFQPVGDTGIYIRTTAFKAPLSYG